MTAERIVACIGTNNRNGMGCDRIVGTSYDLTDWSGNRIGSVTLGGGWRVNSYIGSRMYQAYARIKGREYTGRTFGEGMSVVLRETAASKRNRNA